MEERSQHNLKNNPNILSGATDLFLTQLIRKVGNHDLCGAGNAVLRGPSPPLAPETAGSAISLSGMSSGSSTRCFGTSSSLRSIDRFGKRKDIGSGGGSLFRSTFSSRRDAVRTVASTPLYMSQYDLVQTKRKSCTNPAPTSSPSAATPKATLPSSSTLLLGVLPILLLLFTFHGSGVVVIVVVVTLPLGSDSPWLPGKLHAHLPLQNFLAAEFGNSTFSLFLGFQVDKCVANSTATAWVGRDGSGFTWKKKVSLLIGEEWLYGYARLRNIVTVNSHKGKGYGVETHMSNPVKNSFS